MRTIVSIYAATKANDLTIKGSYELNVDILSTTKAVSSDEFLTDPTQILELRDYNLYP